MEHICMWRQMKLIVREYVGAVCLVDLLHNGITSKEGKMAKCIQTDCHQNKRRCKENRKNRGTETEMERWETTGEGEEEKVKKKEGTIHGQAKSSSIYFQ